MEWEEIYKKSGIVQTGFYAPLAQLTDYFTNSQQQGIKILEVGCGTGRNLIFLQKAFPQSKITGLDSSKTALKLIPKDFKGKTVLYDMNSGLPFEDNYFDIIVSVFVLEHGLLEQIKKNAMEISRALKKGGIFVLEVPSINDFRYKTGTELEPNTFVGLNQSDGTIPHHFFSKEEVEMLFSTLKVLSFEETKIPSVTANGTTTALEFVFRKR